LITSTTVEIIGPDVEHTEEVLTPEALAFLRVLHEQFGDRRNDLLEARTRRRNSVAETGTLDFLAETKSIRDAEWKVASAPEDLRDRRVEITGPTEPKMAINAMNSGAKVWLADLEDANTPHWRNVVGGQNVLMEVTRRTLRFTSPEGRAYALRQDIHLATVVVRPRGLHLDEQHLSIGGKPAVGAFVDFGLYFFHNAKELLRMGSGPYFYLPKMESSLEARLWNDVFVFAQDYLDVQQGTIRATVLIETIPAAFEMDEILYELREHASGLNAGRWDYLFSFIKYFRDSGPAFTLPDRNSVAMTAPFMRAYTTLLVRTCHRRGAFAIGGMAAFIPSRRDQGANEIAIAKVKSDKERESSDGFDGSWVAHPDLVPICEAVFTAVLGTKPNQLDAPLLEVSIEAKDLLDATSVGGSPTEAGLRNNISVALQYLGSWLAGNGAVAINSLMEDAATAEIARSQIWQWTMVGVVLDTGATVDPDLVRRILDEEIDAIRVSRGAAYDEESFSTARHLFEQVALADDYADFLTLPAYEKILADGA
jgi:malate synthase